MSAKAKALNLYKHFDQYQEFGWMNGREVAIDSAIEQRYWDFAIERMKIFHLKDSGQPRPWTEDVILNRNYFTNCYRELDKVSLWIHEWLQPCLHDKKLALLNIMFARYINMPSTLQITGNISLDKSENLESRTRFSSIEGPKFNTAYLFPQAGLSIIGAKNREEFLYEKLPELVHPIYDLLMSNKKHSIQYLTNSIHSILGFKNPFHMTEIMMDFGYQFPEYIDEFKYLEMGRGAAPTCKILNPKAKPEDVAFTLMKHQPVDSFPYLAKDDKKILITTCNIEGIACEFRKYCSLLEGKGRNRKYYGL